jgi:hypothetical protein
MVSEGSGNGGRGGRGRRRRWGIGAGEALAGFETFFLVGTTGPVQSWWQWCAIGDGSWFPLEASFWKTFFIREYYSGMCFI